MNENSNIVSLRQPDAIDDPLTNILRSGARRLLAQAVEFEADAFLAEMKDLKLADGRDRLVARHSDYDWLILSQFRMGKSFGSTRIWMVRATPC